MLSTDQKETLLKLKEMADNVSNTLSELIDGNINKADASNKLGIMPQEFSRNVACNFVYYYRYPQLLSQATADEIQMMLESPYDKLLRDIFNIQDNPRFLIDYELSEKLYDVMQQALNEQELRVLISRYGLPVNDTEAKPQKFHEIAASEHVSKERVRKVVINALRKLRNPEYINQLLPNYNVSINERNKQTALSHQSEKLNAQIAELITNNEYLQEQIQNKEALINVLQDNAGNEQIIEALIDELANIPYNSEKIDDDLPVKCMPLSVRSINALAHANVHTLGELRKKSMPQLLSTKTLGKKCICEIQYVLYTKYNIILRQSK